MLATLQQDSPFPNLVSTLAAQMETKKDWSADTRKLLFAEPTANATDPDAARSGTALLLDLGERVEEYGITPHAHDQIGAHLGISAKFYDKLLTKHPDVLDVVVNTLFEREQTKQMIRTMNGKVRAFLSNGYRPRDNFDLVEQAVLPALEAHPGVVEFKRCDLTETRMYLKIVLPEFERPLTPKVGDVIRGGVIIQNSEVGAGSLGIYPYTDELICTNGAVHTEYGTRQIHVGKRIAVGDEAFDFYSDETIRLDDEAFFAKCRDLITGILSEQVFDQIVAKFHDLRGITVEHDKGPAEVVEILGKRHSFTENERGSILSAFIAGGDLSALGYVRAITQAAQSYDADRQTELETLAGRMVNNPNLVTV